MKTQQIKKYINNNYGALFTIWCILVFVINLVHITGNNFWLDEQFTIYGIKKPVGEMLRYLYTGEIDLFPPLYYIILRGLCLVIGFNGWVYQAASLVPLAVLLLVSGIWIQKEFGHTSAFIFATLCGTVGIAMVFNVEVRCYSLAMLFCFFSYCALYFILKEGRWRDYFLFFLFSEGVGYTHYYAFVSIAFFYVGLLLYDLFYRRKMICRIIVIYILTFVFYFPWFYLFVTNYFSTHDSYIIGVESIWVYLLYPFSGRLYSVVLCLLLLFSAGWVCVNCKKDNEQWFSWWIIIGLLSIILSVILGVGVSNLSSYSFFLGRYIYPISVVAWLVLAICSCKTRKYGKYISEIVIFVMLTGGLWYYCRYSNEFFSEARTEEETLSYLNDMGVHDTVYVFLGDNTATKVFGASYFTDHQVVAYEMATDLKGRTIDDHAWFIMDKEFCNIIDQEMAERGREFQVLCEDGYIGGMSPLVVGKSIVGME